MKNKLKVKSDGSLALRGVVVINPYPPELTVNDCREIARRWNAEPELRKALAKVLLWVDHNSHGCPWTEEARAALAGEGAK